MADYTQLTLFTPKDSLTTGNPSKRIRGSEFDPEFNAISVAIATKYDDADLANNTEAAALAATNKLITPATLSHALQNATVTLGANVQLNGGIAATDVARKSQANTFAATQTISATIPVLVLSETDQGTNAKNWLAHVSGSSLSIGVSTDSNPAALSAAAIVSTRSGITVTSTDIRGTSVTANASTIWHASNDGTGSGLDADLLDGLNASSSDTGNTVAARNANGDLFMRYAQLSGANSENPTISQFIVTNGSDGVTRKASVAHVKSGLAVPFIAYGNVRGDNGTLYSGTVTGVSRTGPGQYTMTASGFNNQPTVIVTPNHTGGVVTARCYAGATNLVGGATTVSVQCSNYSTSNLQDTDFGVLVIGN